MLDTRGWHVVADFWGVPDEVINDTRLIKQAAIRAAAFGQMRVLDMVEHKFYPLGYTLLLLLAESHLSVHTYPEHNYIALDIFTCGSGLADAACECLSTILHPAKTNIVVLRRGDVGGI
ncbi:S-adenosylmethionine decarboxylase proenzyme [Moorella thermoacetica]|uniref:S-adenosylmethionine decarboxylase proenzyme n=1 Tax=Neomoorella thermoacetica TaxID=1525 RepID=A0AAC9HKD7_NEOTH|nr:adenosylmethionine decarboxylase [Moorella thermoacetica]AOQ24711.1 S-adenosylmethionine decarboxylase proenzyme precursor [Moorella thermoacetica]TYL12814.1 S-adenosylmethionine decarboxylase proenzyme [Moorella thermoacetica]